MSDHPEGPAMKKINMNTLTPEMKNKIDAMSYRDLLTLWRFSPAGNPMFVGEVGEYFASRMFGLRDAPGSHAVATSKSVGW